MSKKSKCWFFLELVRWSGITFLFFKFCNETLHRLWKAPWGRAIISQHIWKTIRNFVFSGKIHLQLSEEDVLQQWFNRFSNNNNCDSTVSQFWKLYHDCHTRGTYVCPKYDLRVSFKCLADCLFYCLCRFTYALAVNDWQTTFFRVNIHKKWLPW